jgi:hypothetical protein
MVQQQAGSGQSLQEGVSSQFILKRTDQARQAAHRVGYLLLGAGRWQLIGREIQMLGCLPRCALPALQNLRWTPRLVPDREPPVATINHNALILVGNVINFAACEIDNSRGKN